ncbi:MAG: hypothetical protein DHS20C08_18310 [Rhodomicrobium sp.]|nr:MAG: hypothetical protein DHS20C08_18310 [Rhodomicrobium sp.]
MVTQNIYGQPRYIFRATALIFILLNKCTVREITESLTNGSKTKKQIDMTASLDLDSKLTL